MLCTVTRAQTTYHTSFVLCCYRGLLEGKLDKCLECRILSQGLCEKLARAQFGLDDYNHRHDSEDECGMYYILTVRHAHLCRFTSK